MGPCWPGGGCRRRRRTHQVQTDAQNFKETPTTALQDREQGGEWLRASWDGSEGGRKTYQALMAPAKHQLAARDRVRETQNEGLDGGGGWGLTQQGGLVVDRGRMRWWRSRDRLSQR